MIAGLGDRLKEQRKKAKLTQIVAGNRLGVTKNTISCYENDSVVPSVTNLMKLASLYGTTVDYLLGLSRDNVIILNGLEQDQIRSIKEISDILRELALLRGKQNG